MRRRKLRHPSVVTWSSADRLPKPCAVPRPAAAPGLSPQFLSHHRQVGGEERRVWSFIAGCNDSGVSVLRALGTSACARMSMCPQHRTLRRKLTSVWRTGARNVPSSSEGHLDIGSSGARCQSTAGRRAWTKPDAARVFRHRLAFFARQDRSKELEGKAVPTCQPQGRGEARGRSDGFHRKPRYVWLPEVAWTAMSG